MIFWKLEEAKSFPQRIKVFIAQCETKKRHTLTIEFGRIGDIRNEIRDKWVMKIRRWNIEYGFCLVPFWKDRGDGESDTSTQDDSNQDGPDIPLDNSDHILELKGLLFHRAIYLLLG